MQHLLVVLKYLNSPQICNLYINFFSYLVIMLMLDLYRNWYNGLINFACFLWVYIFVKWIFFCEYTDSLNGYGVNITWQRVMSVVLCGGLKLNDLEYFFFLAKNGSIIFDSCFAAYDCFYQPDSWIFVKKNRMLDFWIIYFDYKPCSFGKSW